MEVSGAAGEDDVMSRWKRVALFAGLGLLMVALVWWALAAYQKKLDAMENEYGVRFEKICYVGPMNDWDASLWYDRSTGVVYVLYYKSITPYMMLDSFGCMTVGVYDEKTGMISPAEFTGEEITVEARGAAK